MVSKYIDGTDLATRLTRSRLPLHEAAELVAEKLFGEGVFEGALHRMPASLTSTSFRGSQPSRLCFR